MLTTREDACGGPVSAFGDRARRAPGGRDGTLARTGLVAAVVMSLSGCFHYVTAPAPDAPQGTPVRVLMERPAPFELSGFTVHDIERVEGEFVTRDERGLFLSATWLEAVSGQGFPGGGWTVRIEEAALRSMEVRRVSWLRSGLLAVGVALGTYFGFDAIYGSGGRGGQSGGGTRPQ